MALRVINGNLYRTISTNELSQILNSIVPSQLNTSIRVDTPQGQILIPLGAYVIFESDVALSLEGVSLPPTTYPLLRSRSYVIPGEFDDITVDEYTWLSGPMPPQEYMIQMERKFLQTPPTDYVLVIEEDQLCVGLMRRNVLVLPDVFSPIRYPVLDGRILRIIPGTRAQDYLQENTAPYMLNVYQEDGLQTLIPGYQSIPFRTVPVRGILCFQGMGYTPLYPFDMERAIRPYITTSTPFESQQSRFRSDVTIFSQ